jgi:hypothetical protein
MVIYYVGGNIQFSINAGLFKSCWYCSNVIKHTSVPRGPRGPSDPDNAIDALVTYARYVACAANDDDSAYDAVTSEPDANGKTVIIPYFSNAYTYTDTCDVAGDEPTFSST